jgi:tetratricopeptide (TPR) repeat protein
MTSSKFQVPSSKGGDAARIDRLQSRDRVLLARLAIFAGGWTLDAAETVCGAISPRVNVQAALKSLGEAGLIEPMESQSGQARFQLTQATRPEAGQWLDASGEREALSQGHIEAFAWVAEQADADLAAGRRVEWQALLDDDYGNLSAALDRALAAGRVGMAIRLARVLRPYWQAREMAREACAHLKAILVQADGLPQEWQARTYGYYADFCLALSDLGSAREACERGLEIVRLIYEPLDLGNLLYLRGAIAHKEGDQAQVLAAYEECVKVRRRIGDQRGLAAALNSLAAISP